PTHSSWLHPAGSSTTKRRSSGSIPPRAEVVAPDRRRGGRDAAAPAGCAGGPLSIARGTSSCVCIVMVSSGSGCRPMVRTARLTARFPPHPFPSLAEVPGAVGERLHLHTREAARDDVQHGPVAVQPPLHQQEGRVPDHLPLPLVELRVDA